MAFVAVFIIACNNPEKEAKENPYVGAWEQTYSKLVYPDSTIETTQFDKPSIKLLTKKYEAFVRPLGEDEVVGGTGEYTFDGDTYTTVPKYHYFPGAVGNTYVMKSKIEGDLWTISYVFKDDAIQVEVTETWKRIIE